MVRPQKRLIIVLIVGGFALWYLKGTIRYWRKAAKEKKIFRYLTNNTEDRPGKQYLTINAVAAKLNIGRQDLIVAVQDSPRLFFCPSDKESIGIYETERSIYEERGIIVV